MIKRLLNKFVNKLTGRVTRKERLARMTEDLRKAGRL